MPTTKCSAVTLARLPHECIFKNKLQKCHWFYSGFHKTFDRWFAKFASNVPSSLQTWEFHYLTVNQMANFKTNLGISWQTLWEWILNTYHKNALSSQAAKYWISIFSFSTTRMNDSCGITLNFLKEYKPRSCVKLRMIDEREETFLGKHWNFILYQFVLDFTAVNAGIGSFTKLHINIHVIQHALSDRMLFPPLLSSIFPLRTKISTILEMVCFGSRSSFPIWESSSILILILCRTKLGIAFPCTVKALISKQQPRAMVTLLHHIPKFVSKFAIWLTVT